jgi:hypothetical protein
MTVASHTIHPGAYLPCRTYALQGPASVVLLDPGAGYAAAEVTAGLHRTGLDSCRRRLSVGASYAILAMNSRIRPHPRRACWRSL